MRPRGSYRVTDRYKNAWYTYEWNYHKYLYQAEIALQVRIKLLSVIAHYHLRPASLAHWFPSVSLTRFEYW